MQSMLPAFLPLVTAAFCIVEVCALIVGRPPRSQGAAQPVRSKTARSLPAKTRSVRKVPIGGSHHEYLHLPTAPSFELRVDVHQMGALCEHEHRSYVAGHARCSAPVPVVHFVLGRKRAVLSSECFIGCMVFLLIYLLAGKTGMKRPRNKQVSSR